MSSPDDDIEARQRHHFERRCRAAKEGRHLPYLRELLLGCHFMSEDMNNDATVFAERLIARIRGQSEHEVELRRDLGALTLSQDLATVVNVMKAMAAMRQNCKVTNFAWLHDAQQRCTLYAACLGDPESALRVAGTAMALSQDEFCGAQDSKSLATAAIGWTALGSPSPSFRYRHMAFNRSTLGAIRVGRSILDDLEISALVDEIETKSTACDSVPSRSQMVEPEAEEVAEPPTEQVGDHLIVFSAIGNSDVGEGKKVKAEFEKVLNKALPIPPVPDLGEVRAILIQEFPHAKLPLDAVLGKLAAARKVQIRPTIFVGPPGSGKTTFTQRLLHLLGVKNTTYSCGGVSDSTIIGTARRWSTGEPSLPVSLARRFETAAPGIVLDEIEKCGSGTHNGNLLDGLLSLFERQSSEAWFDPYINAEVDLSRVIWLATANSVAALPAPLRDRCQIVPFPEPSPEHLEGLASSLMAKLARDRDLDSRWAPALTGHELDALRVHWQGGSIRHLNRLIECVLSVRENEMGRH